MRHLIDEREPITLADIDQAMTDADRLLALTGHSALPPAAVDLIERLSAIVKNTYAKVED